MRRVSRLASLVVAVLGLACATDGGPATPRSDAGPAAADARGPSDGAAPDSAVETVDGGSGLDVGPVDTGVDPDQDTPITDRFRAVAESFERERRRVGAPGAALLILEHGDVTFARGFGSKHPAIEEPVHASTLFRIGSVTKAMTATLLLQLVAAQSVDLEARLSDAISGFSFTRDRAWAQEIHVRDLLRHTTGIVDRIEISCSKDDAYLDAYLNDGFARTAYLMAPPGRMFNYSNPNFALAGLVIERASGLRYRQAIKEWVFDPLRMRRSFFLGEEAAADGDFAYGAVTRTSTIGRPYTVGPTSYDCAWVRPAGYAFMSVRDLATFVLFLARGDRAVLDSTLREAMTSGQIATRELGDLIHYGFGVSVYDGVFIGANGFRRMKVLGHGGAINGYSAEWWYFPAIDFGFIALANTDGASFTETLVGALTTIATLPPPSTPPDVRPDPATFSKYAGHYLDDFNVGRIDVTATSTSVTVSMPDLEQAHIPYNRNLTPTSIDNFVLMVQRQALPVTFILDANGNAEYFRTRAFVGRRLPMLRARSVRRSPKEIDPEDLDRALRAARIDEDEHRVGPGLRALTLP